MRCYCSSEKLFTQCCLPYIKKEKIATTCEQLMRSRFSAYCIRDIDYIYATYAASARETNTIADIAAFANNVHFLSLSISEVTQGLTEGYVSFTVRYIQNCMLMQFTEKSRFVLQDTWFYLDGELADTAPVKIGRNDICPCNSGRKFKHCTVHLAAGN